MGRFLLGQAIPAVLTISELAEGLAMSERVVRRLVQAKSHPAIVVLDGPGHPRFSGAAVQRWLQAGCPPVAKRPLLSLARGVR